MRLRVRGFAAVGLVLAVFALAVPAAGSEAATPLAQEPESGQEAHGEEGVAEGDHAAQEEHGAQGDHGEGDHGEAEHHGPSWTDYVFKWINFALLAALLWWVLVVPPAFVEDNFEFPGLKVVLSERAAGIIAARDLAREQREEAEQRLAESRERLEKVEQEAASLVEEAREDASRERQRLEEEGVEQAARIRATADQDLRSETTRAKRELRIYAADLAVELAAGLVRDNLTDQDQRRLVDEYLEDLGRRVA